MAVYCRDDVLLVFHGKDNVNTYIQPAIYILSRFTIVSKRVKINYQSQVWTAYVCSGEIS